MDMAKAVVVTCHDSTWGNIGLDHVTKASMCQISVPMPGEALGGGRWAWWWGRGCRNHSACARGPRSAGWVLPQCPPQPNARCPLPLPTEIRTQLVEQFKCLEQQSESRLQLLQDLQEFFRRKAEIELEYSRSLEKLAERFSSKIRSSREHQFK